MQRQQHSLPILKSTHAHRTHSRNARNTHTHSHHTHALHTQLTQCSQQTHTRITHTTHAHVWSNRHSLESHSQKRSQLCPFRWNYRIRLPDFSFVRFLSMSFGVSVTTGCLFRLVSLLWLFELLSVFVSIHFFFLSGCQHKTLLSSWLAISTKR